MSTKLITVLLAATLLFTCFTTACQPVTAEAFILQNDAPEQSAEPTSPLEEHFTAPAEWKDELVQSETGKTLNIDADVICPAFDSIDTMSIRPKDFTQEEVDKLIEYFVGDAVLYDGAYQDTKANLEARITEAQQILAMTQFERDAEFGGMTYAEAQQQLKDLQLRYENAPDEPVKTPVTSKLTRDKEGFEVLEVYKDNGGSDDAIIEVYNLAKEISNASFLIRLRDASAGGKLLPYSGTPEEVAQKVLSDLNISGARLLRSMQAKASNDPDNTATVTRLFYEIPVNGLPICSGPVTEEGVTNGVPCLHPETISFDVGENGLASVYWSSHSEIGEPVEENVTLLPFEDIMRKFEEYIFLQSMWDRPAKGMPSEPNSFNVSSIELCMAAMPRKDVQGEFVLAPVWRFYAAQDIPESMKGLGDQEISKRLGLLPGETTRCILTLSAADGSLL